MLERKLCTGSAVLACLMVFRIGEAAPAFQILYHERLEITPSTDATGQQHLGFDAYGRHFDVSLELNDNIRPAVAASRPDIKPYRGTLVGQPGSWVRLTQAPDGWRGVIADGHEIYAIEPESVVKKASIQSLSASAGGSSSAPAIYRLSDALIPDGTAYCGTETGETVTSSGTGTASVTGTAARSTALTAFSQIAKDISMKDTATRQLVVGVVADHQFNDNIGTDPEAEIVSRMDIVDGIWDSQVGISIVLGPVSVLTDTTDTFTATTSPTDLLTEVAGYRAKLPSTDGSALTHLMSGRILDGNIVGISYLGAVCNGSYSANLSANVTSTTMGALIAAHELGHSFNAVHDGVAGACSTTPQTYLMAPVINFSNQFSSCSLSTIGTTAVGASCVENKSSGGAGSSGGSSGTSSSGGNPSVSDPSGTNSTNGSSSTGSGGSSSGGGAFDLAGLVFLAGVLLIRQACLRKTLPLR
jgi:hypothetical protein